MQQSQKGTLLQSMREHDAAALRGQILRMHAGMPAWRCRVLTLLVSVASLWCPHRDSLASQALLEPFCQSLARTRRASLLFRLQDGVFERLLEGAGQGALAHLDTQQLSAHLFHLGEHEFTQLHNFVCAPTRRPLCV